MLYLLWLIAFLAALILYFRQVYSRFSKHGVNNMRPLPLLGNMGSFVFKMETIDQFFDKTYNAFPNDRFLGNYEFMKPTVFIRDLDLIKKITIKDFEHFVDHRVFVDETLDPFFGRNLLSLRGQEWKDMRSTLSPAFTSSKMRQMLPFMADVGHQIIDSLEKSMEQSSDDFLDIDSKDFVTRYANDVIASCAFGLKVDSLSEPNNQFYKIAQTASNFNFVQILKFLGFASFPNIMKILNISFFTDSMKSFFRHLVLDTIRDREIHGVIRPDMIHLLMEAKKGKLKHEEKYNKESDTGFATVEESDFGKKKVERVWSDLDLIAQAVLFILAGFETVSTSLTFLFFELAVNPEIQEKLLKEITKQQKDSDGKVDCNAIQQMKYLDMIVTEVLRKWPPTLSTDRVCAKDYNLGKPNNQSTEDYIIRKDEGINIPIWSIHHDPKFFPEPMKFDPERFSDDNTDSVQPFTYLPFGVGPRNCIGSRFALSEIKIFTYQLLSRFEILPSYKTNIPVVLETGNLNLRIKGGHWLRLKPRV